jgi:hypothetical protein
MACLQQGQALVRKHQGQAVNEDLGLFQLKMFVLCFSAACVSPWRAVPHTAVQCCCC